MVSNRKFDKIFFLSKSQRLSRDSRLRTSVARLRAYTFCQDFILLFMQICSVFYCAPSGLHKVSCGLLQASTLNVISLTYLLIRDSRTLFTTIFIDETPTAAPVLEIRPLLYILHFIFSFKSFLTPINLRIFLNILFHIIVVSGKTHLRTYIDYETFYFSGSMRIGKDMILFTKK